MAGQSGVGPQTSDSVLRPLLGLPHWTHWRLLYSKPQETAPIILGLRAALYQNADGVEGNEKGNGVSHSIPVDQRIGRSAVSSSSGAGGSQTENDFIARLTECLGYIGQKTR